MKVEVKTAEVDGIRMDYFCFGEGKRDFVILPGLSLKPVCQSADQVAEQYQAFAKDYRVWLFDRRSDLPETYSVREMAEDTAAVMKELGIRDACVFGASQGGMMAMFLAAEHPELVKKLVVGSAPVETPSDETGVLGDWIRLAEEGDTLALCRSFAENVYTPGFLAQVESLLPAMAESVTKEDLRKFLILAKGAEGCSIREDTDKISCPVLVLGAKQDKVFGPDYADELAEVLGAEVYCYENYGHAVYDEAPDYKNLILKFFAKKG